MTNELIELCERARIQGIELLVRTNVSSIRSNKKWFVHLYKGNMVDNRIFIKEKTLYEEYTDNLSESLNHVRDLLYSYEVIEQIKGLNI